MKKFISLILVMAMLCSMLVIPMGASAAEITDEERQEIFANRPSQYLDITQITDAWVRYGYGYVEQNLYKSTLKAGDSFERNDSDPLFSRLNNTNYWTRLSVAAGSYNPTLAVKNMAVKLYDLTNGINSGVLTLNSTENVTGTVGVQDEETGLWSLESADYDVYTYLYKGKNGTYKLGPVAEPNKDTDGNWGDDVYSTAGGVVVIGGKDTNGNGIVDSIYNSIDPYTGEAPATSESQNNATLSNINATADFVNVLMQTFSIEGDAVLVPITVKYADNKTPTVKYALETTARTDHMTKVLAIPVNGDEHTQAQLDAYYANKADYYLTAEKMEELGISGVTINDAKFANADIIAPELAVIGRETNRNISQTTTTSEGIVSTTINTVNGQDNDFSVSDISFPVDNTRAISSIDIGAFYNPNTLSGLIASATSNRYYLPITFDAYEGTDYKFYMYLGRQCQERNNLFAISLSTKSIQEKIDELNAVLSVLNSDTLTEEEVKNYRAQIAEIKAESEYVLDSDFDTTALDAAEKRIEDEKAAEEKENALKSGKYTTVDMKLPMDVFATDNDFKATGWYSSTTDTANILQMKGFINNGNEKEIPSGTGTTIAYKVSALADTAGITEDNGKYTYTINGVPFELGTISKADKTMGANGWLMRAKYVPTKYTGTDAVTQINTTEPAVYTATGAAQLYTGEFTFNKSGVKSLNILASDVYPNSTANNRFITATVKYGSGISKDYNIVIGHSGATFADSVFLIPKSDYDTIAADESLTDTMLSKADLDLDEYKTLVQKYSPSTDLSTITAVPGNWTAGTSSVGNTVYNGLKAETKYQAILSKSPVQLSSLNADVDTDKFETTTALSSAATTIIPKTSQAFVDAIRQTTGATTYKTNIANHIIPVDSEDTLESVTLTANLTDAQSVMENSGGYWYTGEYNVKEGMLMLTYNGESSITIDGTEYVPFMKLTRDCVETVIFGMTLAEPSYQDKIDELEERIEALSASFVEEEAEEIVEIKAEYDALLEEEFVTAADFDAALIGKLNNLIAQAEEAAKQKIIKAVEDKIDALSDNFVKSELEAINDAKAAYNEAIAKDNIEDKDFNAVKIAKLNTLIAASARYDELLSGEKYDMPAIDWNYKDNAQYLINAFEISSVVSIERTTDYYASISGHKYINTNSAIYQDTIEEVLTKEDADTDGDGEKNYTGSSRGMSYYPTDKIQAATGTFPAADGKYYITTPKGVKFRIDGVTNTVGGNGVTAGYVTMNFADEDKGSIYKVDFDGKTKYNNVNLLVAGVGAPVDSGSARVSVAAQANVYYADGTVEKQLIVIPSVWGYIPSIAGKLKTEDQVSGVNLPSSPYKNIKEYTKYSRAAQDNEKFDWIPSAIEAEVFSVGSYMTTANKNTLEERHAFAELTNKAGSMASVSVDTKGKAVDYIEITHTEDEVLEAAGAFNAATNNDTHVYWLPISTEEILELYDEDVVGLLDGLPEAKVSECDFYIRVQRNGQNSSRNTMGFVMAASAEKKYANLYAYIEEAEKAMSAITENSSIEEAAEAKELYDLAKSQEGINDTDFNAQVVANFTSAYEAIRQKTDVKGELSVDFIEGIPATVKVKITNLAELAGKPYAVLLTYLDEKGFVVGSESFTGISTGAKNETETFTATKLPETAVKAKAYIWKALGSLKPLGNAVEVEKKSYAVDRFFDAATETFKADATGELNIAFIGDSLTEGTSATSGGVSGNDGLTETHWTYVISKYFEDNTNMTVNLYNAGIGGTTTEFSVPLVKSTVFSKSPDIVILQNVNDLGSNAAKYEAAVENIIRRLLTLDKKPLIMYYHAVTPYTPDDGTQWPVVVSTENHRSWTTQETKKANINAICEKYGVPVIDYLSYFRTYTNDAKDEIMTTLYENDVHPKAAGYQLMGTFATGEFDANPAKYFVRHNDVEDVTAKYETAEDSYTVTLPNSQRFKYNGFTNYETYTGEAAIALINERQFEYPFSGNVQQATTAGATIEFTTDTTELIVYGVNPTEKYRSNYADIYVDGDLVATLNGANPYSSNYNHAKITDGLDGKLHEIKIVTREVSEHESGTPLDIFNFMFIAEKE